jgi:hypothetical protein
MIEMIEQVREKKTTDRVADELVRGMPYLANIIIPPKNASARIYRSFSHIKGAS